MKKIKIILALSLILSFILSSTVFAQSLDSDTSIQLVAVSPEDVPEDVIPAEYNSLEEAIQFIEQNVKYNHEINKEPLFLENNISRATNRNLLVDEHTFTGGSVKLYANYGTSGDASTGIITYISPYTVFDGFSLGYDWVEKSCGYTISSNKKDAYIYASGQLDYYLIIEGGIKLYSEHINLGRTCYLAR